MNTIRTKIVCTIGPATRSPQMLEALIKTGMDNARLNLSHDSHVEHAENITMIRAAAEKVGKPVAIIADLQGPKIRVGVMPDGGVMLEEGEKVTLTVKEDTGRRLEAGGSSAVLIPIQYKKIIQDLKINERILLDDGLLEFKVLEILNAEEALCEVIDGGLLTSRKGLNLPQTRISIESISEKDWADLAFLVEQNVDWVALSFVRRAAEINKLKDYIASKKSGIKVIAKIEKPEALEHIEEIFEAADGIMVARGDLGIEIPTESVPRVQKELIHRANAMGKPVITATQMLDSMIRNPRPTRAEASDVANAILDGTDAIMVSGETSMGKFPIEVVKTMVAIANATEPLLFHTDPHWRPPSHITRYFGDVTDSVAIAACETAFDIGASAIISSTTSGRTATSMARYRPITPIIAVTPCEITQRQLMLYWGVRPLLGERTYSTDKLIELCIQQAVKAGKVKAGDKVVLTAGAANNLPGATNLMQVAVIDDEDLLGEPV